DLPLIDRQHVIVQLQDTQIDRGGKRRADLAACPTAVGILSRFNVGKRLFSILAPQEPFTLPRVWEQTFIPIIRQKIDGLREIVMGVFIMADAVDASGRAT